MAKLCETEGLSKVHETPGEALRVLSEVSFSVGEAEFVTVMGPSGSGKSTLLHCVSGLDRPSAGKVRLGSVDLFALSEGERTRLRRSFLGFVFQFFNLLPDLSVEENILLPLLISGQDLEPSKGRIRELCETLGLSGLQGRLPHSLSGGEMQRVSIARALATRPPLVLADEPTGNLSSRAGEETMKLLRSVRDRFGTSLLLVTHNPRDAAYGDRVLFLVDGGLDPEKALSGPDLDAAAVFSRLEELGI